MIALIVSCLVIASVSCQMTEQHSECVKLRTVCQSSFPTQFQETTITEIQGRSARRGRKGEKGDVGEKGNPGERGLPGIVDYDRIQQAIEERLREALDVQKESILNLTSTLEKTNRKMKGLCPVFYDGKCFVVDLRFPRSINRQDGDRICRDRGGALANIYSENHYNQLMGYLRALIPDGYPLHVWTGMTYDPNVREVILSDGRDAPFVKWYFGYPSGTTTYIAVYADRKLDNVYQHMVNFGGRTGFFGVICEM